jgi:predicted alpha/beta hydrolase
MSSTPEFITPDDLASAIARSRSSARNTVDELALAGVDLDAATEASAAAVPMLMSTVAIGIAGRPVSPTGLIGIGFAHGLALGAMAARTADRRAGAGPALERLGAWLAAGQDRRVLAGGPVVGHAVSLFADHEGHDMVGHGHGDTLAGALTTALDLADRPAAQQDGAGEAA